MHKLAYRRVEVIQCIGIRTQITLPMSCIVSAGLSRLVTLFFTTWSRWLSFQLSGRYVFGARGSPTPLRVQKYMLFLLHFFPQYICRRSKILGVDLNKITTFIKIKAGLYIGKFTKCVGYMQITLVCLR